EVGMRKVLGAIKAQLVPQYLGESVIVTFISLVLAIGLAVLMRGVLAQTTDIAISFSGMADPVMWILILGILLLVGLAAGSYPALYLSRFQPLQVMRSNIGQKSSGAILRKSLVVIQFVISTSLLIGIGILFKQLNYIENMDMGFHKDNRLVIPLQIPEADKKIRSAEVLKKEFSRLPNVIQATATSSIPGNPRGIARVTVEGQPFDKVHNPVVVGVDYNYVEAMGLKLLTGRTLDQQYGTDSTESLLLNEAAVRELELPKDPLGVKLTFLPFPGANPDAEPDVAKVVGIYKDMHFEPVYRDIHPMILRIQPNQYNNLIVNIRPTDTDATLASLETVWDQYVSGNPFGFTFLDEDLAELYSAEQQLKNILTFFTLLAIFIACIGMFGLCAFTTAQRRKEISIRRVIGASSGSIVGLISKDFLVLILIAFPFAAGLAWWGSSNWLQTFAYQTQVGMGVYIGAVLVSVFIAFLTISLLSYRAAVANPIDALYRE
ncbi:MAG: FtsX-like permease family protein, partial [Bacteroidota bacterium]